MIELTYGQKLVGLSFNPSGDPEVTKVKQFFADLIDKCNGQLSQYGQLSEITIRVYRDTISQMVTAQMWAVKMLTLKDER